tara:strand:+ start:19032 stop:20099 length:1068 start_codon:yes stop_codon:yes gene_type:complete
MNRTTYLALTSLVFTATASAQQLYSTDFTDVSLWTLSTVTAPYQWNSDATPATFCGGPFRSAPVSLNFNDGMTYGHDPVTNTGVPTDGIALSPYVDMSLAASDPFLTYWIAYEVELSGFCGFDTTKVFIDPGIGPGPIALGCAGDLNQQCVWHQKTFRLDRDWGGASIGFEFSTFDGKFQNHAGVFIDDLEVFESGTTLECTPAAMHAEGDFVTLTESAFTGAPGTGLHLEPTNGPTGQYGFFLAGPALGAPVSLFEGVLCLSQPTGRYNQKVANNMGLPALNSLGQFAFNGDFVNVSGTSSTGTGFDVPNELPYGTPVQIIAPGETWYFQLWYRDLDSGGAPSANFSDVLGATF